MTDRAAPALLPREPTEAMILAGLAADERMDLPTAVWRAMYDAAPKIESAEAPGADTLTRLIMGLRGPYYAARPNLPREAADALEFFSTRCAALESVIAEHNKRCERECSVERGYLRDCRVDFRTTICTTCPRRYMIEVPK